MGRLSSPHDPIALHELHTEAPDTSAITHSHRSDASSKTTVLSWRASGLSKLLIIPAVLVPLLTSILLLCAHQAQWFITGPLVAFTSTNRASVQSVVSILSHILGGLQTYVLCILVAFCVRIYLAKTPVSLKYLKFFSAVILTRFDLALPINLLLQLALFNSLHPALSALWAGSLTPISATRQPPASSISIAAFSQESRGYWNITTLNSSNCTTKQDALGTFSTCPGLVTPDMFVSAAATASTPSGAILNHTKNDNTQFAYIGRSYGAGSSVGLVSPVTARFPALVDSFGYKEYGYNSSVTCIYNSSSDWHLESIQPGKGPNGIPSIYYALGYLPNSNLSAASPFYALVGWNIDSIVGHVAQCGMDRYLYAFAAGTEYAVLNQIQCEVSYTPCEFHVVVSPLGRNITVTPVQCGGTDVIDVDPTGGLRCRIMTEPALLSFVYTSLYTSLIGQAFLTNIANFNISLHAALQPSEQAALSLNETTLRAVGASLTASIDAAFAALSSSQLLIANSTTSASVNMTEQVLVFGKAWAIYTISAVSMFILLAAVEEAVRTRFWDELPMFNFVDVKSCVLGAALGASSINDSIVANLGSDVWLGDEVEPRLDKVKVGLKFDTTGVSLEAQ
jgi:hypothetical protein